MGECFGGVFWCLSFKRFISNVIVVDNEMQCLASVFRDSWLTVTMSFIRENLNGSSKLRTSTRNMDSRVPFWQKSPMRVMQMFSSDTAIPINVWILACWIRRSYENEMYPCVESRLYRTDFLTGFQVQILARKKNAKERTSKSKLTNRSQIPAHVWRRTKFRLPAGQSV